MTDVIPRESEPIRTMGKSKRARNKCRQMVTQGGSDQTTKRPKHERDNDAVASFTDANRRIHYVSDKLGRFVAEKIETCCGAEGAKGREKALENLYTWSRGAAHVLEKIQYGIVGFELGRKGEPCGSLHIKRCPACWKYCDSTNKQAHEEKCPIAMALINFREYVPRSAKLLNIPDVCATPSDGTIDELLYSSSSSFTSEDFTKLPRRPPTLGGAASVELPSRATNPPIASSRSSRRSSSTRSVASLSRGSSITSIGPTKSIEPLPLKRGVEPRLSNISNVSDYVDVASSVSVSTGLPLAPSLSEFLSAGDLSRMASRGRSSDLVSVDKIKNIFSA